MTETALDKWFKLIHGEDVGDRGAYLEDLLAEDVVFYSPVVFTPQEGRAITKLYLMAASSTFGGDEVEGDVGAKEKGSHGGFRYTKKVISGNQAVLEFETTMRGKFVNGVDIISWNDDGKIVEFKVMIRPLQAVNAVHAAMGAMLKSMQGDSEAAA